MFNFFQKKQNKNETLSQEKIEIRKKIEEYKFDTPENKFKNICSLLENGQTPANIMNQYGDGNALITFKDILQRPLSEKESAHLINLIPYTNVVYHNNFGETSTSLLFYGLIYGTPEIVDAMMKSVPNIAKNVHHIGSGWEDDFTLTNIVPYMKPENLEVYLKYVPATHTSPQGKSLLAECFESNVYLSQQKYCHQNACLLLEHGADAHGIRDEKIQKLVAQYECNNNNTLLHIAAQKNNLVFAQNLISAGFPIRKNKEGKYPEDYATTSMMFHILSVARRKAEQKDKQVASQKPNVSALAQKEQHIRIN